MTDTGVSFSVPEETRMILESLDDFIDQEVDPLEADLGETYANPRLRHEDDGRFVPEVREAIAEVRRKSADAGFYAMNMPEAVGGSGVATVPWYRAKKHVASKGVGLTEFVLAGPEGPKPLLAQAEGDQVERYLEPAVRGEKTTAFALTEPGVGSDAPNMQTAAARHESDDSDGGTGPTVESDGDGWVLDGRKQWITNGPYADFVQVFARTTPQDEVGRYGGITCFIVEADEFEVERINNAVGLEGMQGELVFDDVYLPEDRVLGTVDGAFYDAMEFLALGRLEIAGMAVGHAEGLLDRCVDYAGDREAFGRPIGKYQQVSAELARGMARTYAADAANLRCAWNLDEGETVIEDSAIAKWFATQVFWDVADHAVQVHGANGVAEENPFMDHLHLARIFRIVEGTDEIQLNTIASQRGVR